MKASASFIMSDEKKNESRVVVRCENSLRVEGSGAAPDVEVSLNNQLSPDPPPIVREAVMSSGDARRRVEDEGTEADNESEIISVVGPLSIVGGELEGVTFEEAVGKASPIAETETALDTAGLPIC